MRGADFALFSPEVSCSTDQFLWPIEYLVPGDTRGIQSPAFSPGRKLGTPQEESIPEPSGDSGAEGGRSGQAAG